MGMPFKLEVAIFLLFLSLLSPPIGASLTLENPIIYPREVNEGESVLITVMVKDENNTPPKSVQLWADGRWWEMEPRGGKGNYTEGVLYGVEVPLKKGFDRVIFQAVDGSGEVHTLVYNVTVEVKKSSNLPLYACYTGLALLAILVVLTVISRFRSPRASPPPERLPELGEALCSACGRAVPADAVICPYCGERFVEEEHVCPRCGGRVKPSDIECPHCGAKLKPVQPITDTDLLKLTEHEKEEESKRRCPRCGAVLLEGMKKCPECGLVYEKSTEGGEAEG